MNFKFNEVIAQQTEYKAPPPAPEPPQFEPSAPDAQEAGDGAPIIQHPASPGAGVKLSAEMAVAGLDSLQFIGFSFAHKKKLKELYFSKEEDFKLAKEADRESPAEIEKLENADQVKNLLNKYRAYLNKLRSRMDNLPFTQDEEDLLRKPLEKMIEQNPNFEISPGLGLIIAVLTLAGTRYVDLTQED